MLQNYYLIFNRCCFEVNFDVGYADNAIFFIFASQSKNMNTDSLPYLPMPSSLLKERMNCLGASGKPFLFVLNYKADHGYLIPDTELDERFVRFDFHPKKAKKVSNKPFVWEVEPTAYDTYLQKFNAAQQHIHLGNSFLINLTQPSNIRTNKSLTELYESCSATYKLWFNNQFLVLSPETFVQIRGNMIRTFPMKGTIDAGVPDAENVILSDEKEKAEHATIVDLLRNDLSMVASKVEVARYRYVEKIQTTRGELLQVSSEIRGELPEDYASHIGRILFPLLPAGSICGAPKPSTLHIIEQIEEYDRGFYTGICGYFDGKNLDSAVMIRFVEKNEKGLIFKSGGGITSASQPLKEYNEMIQKAYVPIS